MKELDMMESAMEKVASMDEPIPRDLHNKIMKRVFLAGYGKYLAFSGAILFLNLGVLSLDIYKTLSNADATKALSDLRDGFSFSLSYVAEALATLFNILPGETIIATLFTLALSFYIRSVFMKIYRNPGGIKVMEW